MKRRLRLGMVGGGEGAFIGAVHRIAARLDDASSWWRARCRPIPSARRRVRRAAPRASAATPTIREMARREAARDDGIDAVAIVTPNHLHCDVARRRFSKPASM